MLVNRGQLALSNGRFCLAILGAYGVGIDGGGGGLGVVEPFLHRLSGIPAETVATLKPWRSPWVKRAAGRVGHPP